MAQADRRRRPERAVANREYSTEDAVRLFSETAVPEAAGEPGWLFDAPECQEEFHRIAEKLRPRTAPSIVVAGVSGGEGVTTVALNLAYALAVAEKSRTLIVDANLRSPALHRLLGVPIETGVSDWDGITEPKYRQAAASSNLWFLTAGAKRESIPWQQCRGLVTALRERAMASFDVVFFDAPPIGPYPDALALARVCDGVVLVAESDETKLKAVSYAREQIADVGATILGIVLNRGGRYLPKWLR